MAQQCRAKLRDPECAVLAYLDVCVHGSCAGHGGLCAMGGAHGTPPPHNMIQSGGFAYLCMHGALHACGAWAYVLCNCLSRAAWLAHLHVHSPVDITFAVLPSFWCGYSFTLACGQAGYQAWDTVPPAPWRWLRFGSTLCASVPLSGRLPRMVRSQFHRLLATTSGAG